MQKNKELVCEYKKLLSSGNQKEFELPIDFSFEAGLVGEAEVFKKYWSDLHKGTDQLETMHWVDKAIDCELVRYNLKMINRRFKIVSPKECEFEADNLKKLVRGCKKQIKESMLDIDKMKGVQFENWLKKLFINQGFQVELTSSTADFGVDLILTSDTGKRTAVQAKRYDSKSKISNGDVLKLESGARYHNCERSIFVTTAYYSGHAKEAGQKLSVELWDRNKLISVAETTMGDLSESEKDLRKVESQIDLLVQKIVTFKKSLVNISQYAEAINNISSEIGKIDRKLNKILPMETRVFSIINGSVVFEDEVQAEKLRQTRSRNYKEYKKRAS